MPGDPRFFVRVQALARLPSVAFVALRTAASYCTVMSADRTPRPVTSPRLTATVRLAPEIPAVKSGMLIATGGSPPTAMPATPLPGAWIDDRLPVPISMMSMRPSSSVT